MGKIRSGYVFLGKENLLFDIYIFVFTPIVYLKVMYIYLLQIQTSTSTMCYFLLCICR